jgi:hypothetical protein
MPTTGKAGRRRRSVGAAPSSEMPSSTASQASACASNRATTLCSASCSVAASRTTAGSPDAVAACSVSPGASAVRAEATSRSVMCAELLGLISR